MLRFPYLEEPLAGGAPPSLAAGAVSRWRPLVPIRIIGPMARSRLFLRALLDPGSDDTIFPIDVAQLIGVERVSTKHAVRWRGRRYALDYGEVELQLEGGVEAWRWSAVVGFSDAPIRYPLLGIAGCLEVFDVTYWGRERVVQIEKNRSFPA